MPFYTPMSPNGVFLLFDSPEETAINQLLLALKK